MSTMPSNKILVVANETVASDVLHAAIRAQVYDEAGTDVLVVAPALNSWMRHWASDDDAARRAADGRLEKCLEQLEDEGIRAEGIVGDADPVQAIEDALVVFPADGIVIATRPEGRSNWLARGLLERISNRFPIPLTHIVVEADVRLPTGTTSLAA
jgi:hypothetical protein